MANGNFEPGRDRGTVTTETDVTYRAPGAASSTTWPPGRLVATGGMV